MLSKKKKIIILSTMLILLIVTGYLNVAFNSSVLGDDKTTTTSANANFFVSHREYRETTRNQEILYYDAIIASENSTQEAKTTAEANKMKIIATMEKELVLEGLIKAKGFEDCVVSLGDETVNVIVKAATLESSQVAQIVSVVTEQTDATLGNIKINPLA